MKREQRIECTLCRQTNTLGMIAEGLNQGPSLFICKECLRKIPPELDNVHQHGFQESSVTLRLVYCIEKLYAENPQKGLKL